MLGCISLSSLSLSPPPLPPPYKVAFVTFCYFISFFSLLISYFPIYLFVLNAVFLVWSLSPSDTKKRISIHWKPVATWGFWKFVIIKLLLQVIIPYFVSFILFVSKKSNPQANLLQIEYDCTRGGGKKKFRSNIHNFEIASSSLLFAFISFSAPSPSTPLPSINRIYPFRHHPNRLLQHAQMACLFSNYFK